MLWSSNETSRSSSRNTPTATNGATIRNNLAPSSEQHLVAIVGAAHVPGIAAEWEKLQREVSVAGLRSLPHLTQRNYNQIRSDHFESLQPARIKDLHEVEVCILFSSFWCLFFVCVFFHGKNICNRGFMTSPPPHRRTEM